LAFLEPIIYFNGQNSFEIHGIKLISLDSGFVESPAGGSKNIISEKSSYRDIPFYYRTELNVMQFKIVISPIEKVWTPTLRQNVFEWISTRTPKEFRTNDDYGKLCYCICTNELIVMQNAIGQGYVELEFTATTPYWLSEKITQTENCTTASVEVPIVFEIFNYSNVLHSKFMNDCYYFPKMTIDLYGSNTGINLINTSDGNRAFTFTELSVGESLYIDNDLYQIISSTDSPRINDFNKNWFRLVRGNNIIQCTTPCTIQYTCQYPIYR